MHGSLPALPAPDLQKLVNVVARMASDHDGEALNATRLAVRQLGRHHLRMEDVVTAAFTPRPTPASRNADPDPVAPARSHQAMARSIIAAAAVELNDYQLDFVRKMAAQRQRPTEKQAQWVQALYSRFVRGAA